MDFTTIKHGFGGFSRITRIGSWGNLRKSDMPDKIRVNLRKSVESVFNSL
ncbi:MAG: hypothetical protein FWG87_08420 [Defluviitaleaceae bacterium]|nr:hypothetical protein [Defluviitaleaceae bacterium]